MGDIKSNHIGVVGDHAHISGGINIQEHHHYNTTEGSGDGAVHNNSSFKRTAGHRSGEDDSDLLHVLHISDLHCSAGKGRQWAGQLADDLKQELDCRRIHAMIISGDVANTAVKEEYAEAITFIEQIRQEFHIEKSNLVIVPGNHDVNRKLSKKGYTLIDEEDLEEPPPEGKYIPVGDEVIRLRNDSLYMKRFQPFSEFYETVTGVNYPLDYSRQGVIHHLKDDGLLILGLNSAWQVDHHYKNRAGICDDALDRALTKIRQTEAYAHCLKLAVWHHPISSSFEDRITDLGFMQRLALNGFCVCFHGHMHRSVNELFRYDHSIDGRKIEVVGAGTFGAPTKSWMPGYPLQYNLLKISSEKLTVETRCRPQPNGVWQPDARWTQGPGQDPLPRYFVHLPPGFKKKI